MKLNAAMNRRAAIIADDDIQSRAQIADHASNLGYDIVIASDLDEITASSHDLSANGRVVLVSVALLSSLDPMLLRREVSRGPGHAYLILILDRHAPEPVTSAYGIGADDVIAKPLIVAEIDARLNQAARVLDLEAVRDQLEGEASLLDEISARTTLHSRRYFDARLASELTRASRYAHSTALALAHLHWDTWAERDMRALDQFFSAQTRSNVDWLVRYDAHMRAFVLPETTLPGALSVTRRLSSAFSSFRPTALVHRFRNPSIKFGVTSLDPAQTPVGQPPDARALLYAAEAYLHDAMRSGREIVAGPVPYNGRSAVQ